MIRIRRRDNNIKLGDEISLYKISRLDTISTCDFIYPRTCPGQITLKVSVEKGGKFWDSS